MDDQEMTRDQDVIREQMENTRTALSEKLEELENRVTAKVAGATQDVAQTVETVTGSVQETVETVKDTVQETVETVKDTVEETISAVKESVSAVKSLFDVPAHVDRYPWTAMGASVAVGYLGGEYLLRPSTHRSRSQVPAFTAKETIAAPVYTNGQSAGGRLASELPSAKPPSWLDRLEPELSKLKGLALGVLMGTIREMVTQATGEKLGHSLAEIIDSATEKIGGTPVPPETLQSMSAETPPERAAVTV